jgi:hypothetical protein
MYGLMEKLLKPQDSISTLSQKSVKSMRIRKAVFYQLQSFG